jgi:hypothetical protein
MIPLVNKASGSKGHHMNVPLRVFPTIGHSAKSPNFDEENELEIKKNSQNQSIGLVFLLTSCLSKWFHRDKVYEIEAFLWLTSILDCKKELISQGIIYSSIYSSMAEEFTPQQNMILHQPKGSGHWESSRTMETPEITTGS